MTVTTTVTIDELDRPVVWADDLVDIGHLHIVGPAADIAAALHAAADRVAAALAGTTAVDTFGPDEDTTAATVHPGDLVLVAEGWRPLRTVLPVAGSGRRAVFVLDGVAAAHVWDLDRGVFVRRRLPDGSGVPAGYDPPVVVTGADLRHGDLVAFGHPTDGAPPAPAEFRRVKARRPLPARWSAEEVEVLGGVFGPRRRIVRKSSPVWAMRRTVEQGEVA